MNLRSLDLNLLVVFDAIYSEGSISRAAERLHLSQPAVSNALARLRERLGDTLFERSASGMRPTPRARAMAGALRQGLTALESGLRGHREFEYASSEREFVIAVGDYGETVILPRFIDWLEGIAPGIRIRILAEPVTQLKYELRDGIVDLALDYFPLPGEAYRSYCVLRESLVSLVRPDHPHVGGELTLPTYLSLRHVVLAHRANASPMIDLALSKRGLRRNVAVTVPHFLSMPMLVKSSDMICTLPERMALIYGAAFGLRRYAVPLRVPRFPVYLIWHESVELDAGHRWLRSGLMACCASL